MDRIEHALTLGEVSLALQFADQDVRAARKRGGPAYLAALRRRATIVSQYADDEHMDSLAIAVRSLREVTKQEGATASDLESLAWAELLSNLPRRGAATLKVAKRRQPTRPLEALEAAVAWVSSRAAADLAVLVGSAVHQEDGALEGITRLVVQSHGAGVDLAKDLYDSRARRHAIWDRRVERAVQLLARAYRVSGGHERAADLLTAWVRGVESAIPDPDDARRLVVLWARLDGASPEEALAAHQARLVRAVAAFGADNPALEAPLRSLAVSARRAGAHAIAVTAFQALDPIVAKKRGADALAERAVSLAEWRRSLLALRRLDDARSVVAVEEGVAARRPLQLVPYHHARAEICEAAGDLDGMVSEHLAAVAQYEAAPPPVYGPSASNTELARGWARQALARAGRADEADTLVPKR